MKKIFKQKVGLRRQVKVAAAVLQNVQQRTIGLLIVLTLVLVVLYIYFIGMAVVYAIDREETQGMVADAGSRIAELEVDYLQGKNTITLGLATTLGFSTISSKDYVTRSRYLGQASTQ